MSSGWTVADTAVIHNKSRNGQGTLQRQRNLLVQQQPATTPTQPDQNVDDLSLQELNRQHSHHSQLSSGAQGGQRPSSNTLRRSNSSGKNNHVRWSDTFHRSKSEEELDKLLDGLDQLTETLPDLQHSSPGFNKVGGSPSKPSQTSPVKTKPSKTFASASPLASPVSSSSSYSVPQTGQFPSSNHSSSQQISPYGGGQGGQFTQVGKETPNVNTDVLGSYGGVNAFGPSRGQKENNDNNVNSNRSALHKSVVQHQHLVNSHSKPSITSPDYSSIGSPESTSECESGVVSSSIPSVRQTRQILLSRETYDPCPSETSQMDGGTATATSGPYRQPYHTLNDSKPFSYIRATVGGSKPASRAQSREALNMTNSGLESPSLLRKLMGGGRERDHLNGADSPEMTIPIQSIPKSQQSSVHIEIRPSSETQNGSSWPNQNGDRIIPVNHQASSSAPPSTPTRGFQKSERTVPIQHSGQRSIHPDQTDSSSSANNFTSSAFISPAPYPDNDFHLTSSALADMEASLSWLERQQKKLNEKRELDRKKQNRTIHHHHHEFDTMVNDLRSASASANYNNPSGPKSETTTDGYASDLASMLYSETSTRESSPFKPQTTVKPPNQSQPPPTYTVPLKVDPGYYDHSRNSTSYASNNNTNNNNTMQFQKQKTATLNSTSNSSSSTLKNQTTSQFNSINQHNTPSPATYNRASSLSRQNSDTSYDRVRPFVSRRVKYDSESEVDGMSDVASQQHSTYHTLGRSRNGLHASNTSLESSAFQLGGSQMGSRPITPAFPSIPGTPYLNQSSGFSHGRSSSLHRGMANSRAPSPGSGSLYQSDMYGTTSRRGSFGSVADVAVSNVKLAKDHCKYWYKPNITREEAIGMLRNTSPGTFVVRDSNSFPGAFGLALKVAQPPVNAGRPPVADPSSELIRHFLIEPTTKGVKLKGYNNEPVFASLSALVYQHTITPLALPIKLVLPQSNLVTGLSGSRESLSDPKGSSANSQMQQLLAQGAACNVIYLFTMDTDSLTGPVALKNTVSHLLINRPKSQTALVHFKVSGQGITLTDNMRKLFFRRHHNTPTISFCGIDPEDRRYTRTNSKGKEMSHRIFGFVAKKPTSRTHNQCHIFAEYEPEQPARAIVNFVNKVMLNGNNSRADVV